MGLMSSALQIGRSALLTYQSALEVVGNNISNVGTPNYTRQTPVLNPAVGVQLPEGFTPGGGVTLSALQRNVDETLEDRLRVATGDQADALVQQETLGRIESIMNELSDNDLSSLMQDLFNAFSALQNQPHDIASRATVVTAGQTVATEIQRQRDDVLSLRGELNQQLKDSAIRADEIATEVAELNIRIVEVESGGKGAANSLRDQQEALLRELGELIQIEVREQPDGGLNVYIGNEPLVQGGLTRGLTTTLETVNSDPKIVVRFADNEGPITIRGGKMAGLISARDEHVMGQIESLNSMARALIEEVNKVHAMGQGLEGFTDVTGTYAVLDPSVALNSADAGLDLTPQNGSFLLTVTDTTTGVSRTSTITVDLDGVGTDESLNSLVSQINTKVSGIAATATTDNRLRLATDSGYEMTFAEDTSNVLAALGVNSFFSGEDAQDLAVNSVLTDNVNLLAAATQYTPGDGTNAANVAALGESALTGLNNMSLNEFYNAIVSDVAVKASAALSGVEAADSITLSLTAQRESISGVSLDEETISLLRLERSFQGAARYTTTVDRLIQETLALVG